MKSESLDDADRKALRDQIAMDERFQDLTDEQALAEWKKLQAEVMRTAAVASIQDWKFKRAIFKQYGGRIIRQQIGLEPIEAERAFLQEREKAGDFAIYGADLKEGFWRYWKRGPPFTTEKPTGHEFDTPWWLDADTRK